VDLFPQLVYPVHLDTLNLDWTKLHGWSRSHQGDGRGKIIILFILNKTFLKSGASWKGFSRKKGGDNLPDWIKNPPDWIKNIKL
jgi:hypothetical protein